MTVNHPGMTSSSSWTNPSPSTEHSRTAKMKPSQRPSSTRLSRDRVHTSDIAAKKVETQKKEMEQIPVASSSTARYALDAPDLLAVTRKKRKKESYPSRQPADLATSSKSPQSPSSSTVPEELALDPAGPSPPQLRSAKKPRSTAKQVKPRFFKDDGRVSLDKLQTVARWMMLSFNWEGKNRADFVRAYCPRFNRLYGPHRGENDLAVCPF